MKMKMHDIYRFKREALGKTQKEVAEAAGMSASTVANFESGNEVSIMYRNAIMHAIDNEISRLSKFDYLKLMMMTNVMTLDNEEPEHALKNLGYISMYVGKLQIEIMSEI